MDPTELGPRPQLPQRRRRSRIRPAPGFNEHPSVDAVGMLARSHDAGTVFTHGEVTGLPLRWGNGATRLTVVTDAVAELMACGVVASRAGLVSSVQFLQSGPRTLKQRSTISVAPLRSDVSARRHRDRRKADKLVHQLLADVVALHDGVGHTQSLTQLPARTGTSPPPPRSAPHSASRRSRRPKSKKGLRAPNMAHNTAAPDPATSLTALRNRGGSRSSPRLLDPLPPPSQRRPRRNSAEILASMTDQERRSAAAKLLGGMLAPTGTSGGLMSAMLSLPPGGGDSFVLGEGQSGPGGIVPPTSLDLSAAGAGQGSESRRVSSPRGRKGGKRKKKNRRRPRHRVGEQPSHESVAVEWKGHRKAKKKFMLYVGWSGMWHC